MHDRTSKTLANLSGQMAAGLIIILCAGALWTTAALYLRHSLPMVGALGCAIAGGYIAQWAVFRRRAWVCAWAAILTCLAITYAQYLYISAIVAAAVGTPYYETITALDAEMVVSIAIARHSAFDLLLMVLAPALAACIAARPTRQLLEPISKSASAPARQGEND